MTYDLKIDPKRDLVLDRLIDVPRELVWKCWTIPEHVSKWFTPKPWYISDCEIDLRPGGIFRTVMNGPDGEQSINYGCFLDIVPNERLIWTDALRPGYRPAESPFLTAVLLLKDEGPKTRYTAAAIHRDEDTRNRHEEMGFYDGWGTVLDQMIDYSKTI